MFCSAVLIVAAFSNHLSSLAIVSNMVVKTFSVFGVPEPPSRDLTPYTYENMTSAPGPWPQHFKCRSDINLSLALRWLGDVPKRELPQWLVHLPIGRHRCNDPPEMPSIKGVKFLAIRCTDDPCERCSTGRGGYIFKHLGPWAPGWIVCPDGMHPKVHHDICLHIMSEPSSESSFFRDGAWHPDFVPPQR